MLDIQQLVAPVSLDSAPAKKKRNNHKKRSQKNKTNLDLPYSFPGSLNLEQEVDDGWTSVISKKTKIIAAKEITGNSSSTPSISAAPINHSPQSPADDATPSETGSGAAQKKRRRRKADKPKTDPTPTLKPQVPLIPLATAHPVVHESKPAPVTSNIPAPVPVAAQPATTVPPRHRRKTNSFKNGCDDSVQSSSSHALLYAHELEFLVSESLGADAVAKARSSFPSLVFSRPPPDTSSTGAIGSSGDNARTALSDIIQMKAHLRAKEAECQVLRDEVVRMHTAQNQPTAPVPSPINIQPVNGITTPSKQQTSQPARQGISKSNIAAKASKQIQCSLTTPPDLRPTTQPVAQSQQPIPPPPPPAPAPAVTESLVIKTFQDEIARLAQKNTLLSQRNDSLKAQLKASRYEQTKVATELQQSTAEAVKQAEVNARQSMEGVVKQMEADLLAKTELLTTQTAQLEGMEQQFQAQAQDLHRIRLEYETVVDASNSMKQQLGVLNLQLTDAQTRLGESLKLLAQRETERDVALRQEAVANQQLALAQSSLEAESVSVKQRLVEVEADLETARGANAKLEVDLATARTALVQAEESLATASTNHNTAIADVNARLAQAHKERDEAVAKADAATAAVAEAKAREAAVPVSQIESTEPATTAGGPCKECAELSAEVDGYKDILSLAETALSQLQQSVGQEESRWQCALKECAKENSSLKSNLAQLMSERDEAMRNCEVLRSITESSLKHSANNGNAKASAPAPMGNGMAAAAENGHSLSSDLGMNGTEAS